MSYEVFDFDMTDKETLVVPEGSRLVRLLTGNDMDAAYCIVPSGIDGDELRLTICKRFGNGLHYQGYEDVSYLLED